ncbi:ATP-binding cassette domain-containing protein [Streptomyces sp. NPDC017936]|uniref:ATP-binding cassette domain-containing protein n=1 Tax=Streptomyces sp. NPDC017936 TaxID=3365016 RepID=UPI0037B2D99A
MAQLDIVDVGHAYAPGVEEERWALKPLKPTFESGKTYALVGPSGCGKSTLLNILSGLVRPSRGRVLFDGADVTVLPAKAHNIAQVFQFPSSASRRRSTTTSRSRCSAGAGTRRGSTPRSGRSPRPWTCMTG